MVAVALLTMVLVSAPAGVAAPPADFQTSLVTGDGLNGPSGFEIAPDGRIFVLERSGKIKIVKDGELLPTPFADLPSENTGDRGLMDTLIWASAIVAICAPLAVRAYDRSIKK